jgi:two-component system chemotaxis response regulator CheY
MKKLRGHACGLVLSDLYMEPMDGLELLRTMRTDESLNTIPFIIITASAQPDKVAETKALGANGYILKPFNISTLKRTLTKVLGSF